MNNQPLLPPEPTEQEWEKIVRETARHFPYPPTPNIAAGVVHASRSRRVNPIWRVALAIILIALILTLAVPEVRAVVLEFIQIGAVRIFPVEPTATSLSKTPTARPTSSSSPFEVTPLPSALDLPGATTLDDARAKSRFDFGLPTYPADLGTPDHVFLQDHNADLVTVVWVSHDQPDQVRLVLEILNDQLIVSKMASMENSQYVRVNGRADSLWLPNPHIVHYYWQGGFSLERLVQGNVLIWKNGDLTFRLETDLSIDEAVRIAESLR